MSYTLFIADLHLAPDQPDTTAALETLLQQHAGKASALYVLGDLFESWIGDDDDDSFNVRIIRAFQQFSAAGSALFFMHGNRDFLLGDDFAQQCGGTLLKAPTVIDLYGKPTLLLHGDELCIDDVGYQQFRQMVRSEAWQSDILAKSLPERRMIAQFLRMKSQADNSNKAENIMDVNEQEVLRVLAEHQVDHMIHGHTHRPTIHQLANNKSRAVLGDWYTLGWLLRADNTGNELISFPL